MQFKNLLSKTLLVAGLLWGGVNYAWADKSYTIVFNQDFEDGETFSSGWVNSNSGRMGITNPSRSESSKCISLHWLNTSGNNGTNGYNTSYFTNSSYLSATDYKIEFDFSMATNNANANYPSLVLTLGSNTLTFVTTAANYTSNLATPIASNINYYDASTSTTTTLGAFTSSTSLRYFTIGETVSPYWYRVTIVANAEDGTKLTVTSCSDATETATYTLSEDMLFTTKMQFNTGKSYTAMALDNFSIGIYSETEIVPNPSAAITGVNGTDRTVTMTLGTGSSDGTVIKYYTDTDSKSDLTAYSAPFTVSSTSTIYYYAESTSGATSDEQSIAVTCEAITLNAPTITRSSNTTVTISDNQSDLDASPASTIYYSYNGSEYAPYTSAITVTADATVSAYSTATGYTQSATSSRAVAPFPPTGFVQIENTPTDKSENASSHTFATETTTTEKATYAAMLLKDGTQWGKNVYLQTAADRWGVRNDNNWYVQNTSWLMMKSMKSGEIIVVNSDYQASSLVNATYSEKYSFGNEFAYIIDADGDVEIGLAKPSTMHYFYGIYAYSNNYVSVTVSAAGFATYVNNDYDLDFTSTSIEAYKVKVSTKGTATLTKLTKVPAGTPVLLYKEGGATEAIPVTTGAAAISDNDLVAGTGSAVATTDGGYTNMILNNIDGNVGFYFAAGQTVATNRAYLHFDSEYAPETSGARPMNLVFEDMTGINSVKGEEFMVNGSETYNLQGQRVAQPTKGLYIINGKKVMVK